jgi:hypothetical protein
LTAVLSAAGIADATAASIVASVSHPLPDGCPLSPANKTLVDNALASSAGRPLVDQMDSKLMQTVLNGIDSCIAASGARPIAPEAQLYIALWVNMTGAPTTLAKWLAGTAVAGVAPPSGATVSATDLQNYLLASAYFRNNPKNFPHMQSSVAAGVALLPATAAAV